MKPKRHESSWLFALVLAGSLCSCNERDDAKPKPDPTSTSAVGGNTGDPPDVTTAMGETSPVQGGDEAAPVGSGMADSGMAGDEAANIGDMTAEQAASAGVDGGLSPAGAPTFTAIYEEILVDRCSGPICHSGATGGNLIMTNKAEAYEALVSAPAEGVTLPGICEGMPPNCADLGVMRVVPNDPEASLLLDKIMSLEPRCGCPMPTSPPQLSEAEIEQVRAWIVLGAAND